MKAKSIITVAALFAAALFILDVPAAMATTYYAVADGNWTSQIWNTTGCEDDPNVSDPSPGVNDQVYICSGVEVTVTTSEEAGYVTLHAGQSNDWTRIIISTSGTLDLTGTTASTINQYAVIELTTSTSTLGIKADHTVSGSGKIDGSNNTATIEIDPNDTFTSTTTIEGALEIRAGSGTFTNGSTGLVHADGSHDQKILTVYNGTIDDASGAEWKVSGHDDAILRFDVAATGLEGDFTVMQGMLDINQNVDTEGDLGFTGGKIDVESGDWFKANQ